MLFLCTLSVSAQDAVVTRPQKAATNNISAIGSSPSGYINNHGYVDLGLSVKWATCNIGATTPSDYGGYYKWSNDNSSFHDIAREKWGKSWRIPTKEEIEELCDRCRWKWTKANGHNGYLVTGPTGNSIFLPAAGKISFLRNNEHLRKGDLGSYLSSSKDHNGTNFCLDLCFYYGEYYVGGTNDKRDGFSARPVTY